LAEGTVDLAGCTTRFCPRGYIYALISQCSMWHMPTQGWASECPDVKNYKWLA